MHAWGGEPCEAWWRGNCPGLATYPSTTLRVVPLPIASRWGGSRGSDTAGTTRHIRALYGATAENGARDERTGRARRNGDDADPRVACRGAGSLGGGRRGEKLRDRSGAEPARDPRFTDRGARFERHPPRRGPDGAAAVPEP